MADDSMKSQIEHMLSSKPEEEEEVEVVAPTGEEEQEEPRVEEPEGHEEGGETPEAPVKDEQEEEEDSPEDGQTEAEKLRNQVNSMAKKLKEAGLSIESTPVVDEAEDKGKGEEDPQIMEFLTEDELETIQDNPKKLNEVLNRVYNQARQDSLKSIPSVVQKTTNRQITLRDKVRDFYGKNPDLEPHRDFVGFVASEIEAENPDKDLDWIFQESAKETRKRLGLREEAEEVETKRRKSKEKKPAFATKPRGPRGVEQDTRNEQQKQIDQVIDL